MIANAIDLKAEAVLDPAIQFKNPLTHNWQDPKAIFLTGSTGFLGAYLLSELLQNTAADIYCLVRSDDRDSGKERLKKHLEFYSLWDVNFAPRIIIVMGDLSEVMFGLSEKQFSELADRIDTIYHNGALVNSVYSYSKLKATNVLGTQEVLRLASLSKTKPVHFVSTITVFSSQKYAEFSTVKEVEIPEADAGLKGGYKQSKWVAEMLVAIARERGLPACIYRPSRILGHSQTGITGNLQDLWCSLIKGCIQFGKFPILETDVNIVPVDYVSQAIVRLSQQETSLNKAFHVLNPQSIPWTNLFDQICSLGYNMDGIGYNRWIVELKEHAFANRENALYPLLPLLLSSANTLRSPKPEFDTRQTVEELAGYSIVCPKVDRKLISTYLSYFQNIGYIPVMQKKATNSSF